MDTQLTYPLTDAQKRIWYTEMFYPGTGISNIGGAVRFNTTEPFDAGLLKQAINHYVRLNDTIRLRMLNEPGSEPKQIVAGYQPFEVEVRDFSEENDDAALDSWADAFIREPIPFYEADLFAFAIARTGESRGCLLIKVNHILSDGNGMILTINDIIDTYLALAGGKEVAEEQQSSYLDYLPAEQEYKGSDRYQKDKGFWNDKFKTLPEFTSLKPTDSYSIRTEADREVFVIPPALEEQIRQFCGEHNLGVLTLFLAALYTYCYRITGHEDLVVGTFLANRTNAKEKAMPGMFVSTTPVRMQLAPETDFLSFARSVLKEQMGVLRHQKYPYNTILNDIKVLKPDISSLFGLSLEYIVMGWKEKEGISYVVDQLFCGQELNDLFISVKDQWDKNELQIVFDYRTELFARDEIHEMCRHLLVLVEDAVYNPGKSLSELELCSPEEKRRIVEEFNNTDAAAIPGLTTIALFEEQVLRVPDRIAVKCGDIEVTYRELNERANRLARALAARGVGRDDRVAILLERKPLMVECILAIWKAGGAYVPVDPAYPGQRIVDMIADSGARCVLTESGYIHDELVKALPESGFFLLDEAVEELAVLDGANCSVEIVPGQLAYMIYTSGSTGKPKGAMLEHAGMLNHIEAMVEELGMNEHCVMAQNAPHCFDISVWQFVTALTLGGTTVIYPNELILNPRAFIAEVERDGVTVLEVVVSFMAALLEMELDVKLAALECLLVTGEAAKPHLVRLWFDRFDHIKVINAYGPTEACDDITLHIMDCAPESDVMPIGKPVRNLKVYVVDKHMNLLPVGVIGELCVSGIGVGRGYMNDPERTAKAFMEDPFREERGIRLYRTGDLARWLPDGSLEYMGRIDHQVKIRGHRIECGDIEARLQRHEALKEVLVLDRSDASGNKYLCAYYTGTSEVSSAELRAFVGAELPNYMVPSHFVGLESFPLTPNGKIDRKALPEPEGSSGDAGAQYVAPRSDAEQQLANIWGTVLGFGQVGVRDNYFELGGDSLKAMLIMANIYKQYGVELPLRELFETPTVEGLALVLGRSMGGAGAKRYEAISPVPEQELYAVSSAQKRMYLLHMMEDESTAYNMPGRIAIEGKLNVARVREALQALVERHESLRTSFAMIDGVPFQKVHAEIQLEVPVIKASEQELSRLEQEFIRTFDLTQAPLLRMMLVELGEERYALFLDMHHIISDGVSIQLFLEQFGALYRGAHLPELRVQYKDFSAWQNRLLESETMREQEAYWLEQFAGELPVLALPADYPRPSVQSFDGDRFWFHAGSELTAAVRETATATGTTPYMVLLAAYQALLFKYTGQNDHIVGTPIAGRAHADVSGVFGMFVNTLGIRTYASADKTFTQLVQEVKDTLFQAYEHQDYPLDLLVEKLDLERDTSRNPLFDTMFVHLSNDIVEMELDGLTFKVHELDEGVSKFDLLLEASERAHEIRFKLQYCTALFRKDTMDRLAVHYMNLLQAVTAQPEVRLGQIDLLTPEEKTELLSGFGEAQSAYPEAATIAGLFEKQAAAVPGKLAVTYEGRSWTYRELNERANCLARTLRECGVTRNSPVAVLASRSIEMIAAMLAVVKAGGAYVALDPARSGLDIPFVLQDCEAAVLLTGTEHVSLASGYEGIVIDMMDEAVFTGDGSDLPSVNEPDDGLAILYRAAGNPDGTAAGVMLTHRNVASLLSNDHLPFQFGSSDVWAMIHSHGDGVSVWEMYGALLNGGQLVAVPQAAAHNPAELAELLRIERVTVLNGAPRLLYALMHEEARRADHELALRCLFFSGETLNPAMLRPWREKYPHTRLLHMYGFTEVTVHAAYKEIGDGELASRSSIHTGALLPNVAAYIFDESMGLAPAGVISELYVGGAGAAQGYWNRPALTAERFIANPYKPEEVLFRTGALARITSGGELEYFGDREQQQSIRGNRMAWSDIEAVLLQSPQIREAAVWMRSAADNESVLTAYYIENGAASDTELRALLSEQLPPYMIPSCFVRLESMPLTEDGRLDAEALPAPGMTAAAETVQAEPHTETEERMIAIWKELLGVDGLEPQDDFFQKGGHSLSAAMLAARILKEFKTKMPLRTIFKHPTIAELAASIDEKTGGAPAKAAAAKGTEPGNADAAKAANAANASHAEGAEVSAADMDLTIAPAPIQPYYPLSSAQKRLFVLDRLEGENAGTAYNLPAALIVEGEVDRDRLQRAFGEIIRRHEALRTSFKLENGEPVQRVLENVDFTVHYSDTLEADIPQAVKRFVRPFDLASPPLLRIGLTRLAEGRQLMLFDMHHIVSDGISVAVIIKELIALYGNESLPALRLQYKDYAVWQQNWIAAEDYRKQESYWLGAMAGELPVLELPYDYQRPPVQSFDGHDFKFELDADLAYRLNALTAETGTTLYMVLLAAYKVLLFKYSGANDFIVGTPIANRGHADLNDMIGMFVNTLAIRTYPDAEQTFTGYLGQVKERALEAFDHQEYPFEELVDKLGIRRDLSRNPLFDTMFSVNNVDTAKLELAGLPLRQIDIHEGISKFDISLEAREENGTIGFVLEYCTRLFREETARRFASHYVELLGAIVKAPRTKLGELPVLTEAEKHQIIDVFNHTDAPIRQGATTVSLFEEQAARYPERIAVRFGEETVTYAELNRRANRLARLLLEKGVGRDDRVAIFMDRKPSMVECILAIWKSGGAYVPVDPLYPTGRIVDMIGDSEAKCVLTESQFVSGELQEALPGAEFVALDTLGGVLATLEQSNPEIELVPEQLAYLIYTSGSTGKPKGAMLEHAGMLNHIEAMIEELHMKDSCVMAQNAPHCFDISVWQFVTALTIGGTTVIYPNELITNPNAFIAAVARDGVTVLEVVVSFMSAMLEMEIDTELPALEYLLVTGENAKAQLARQWFQRYPHIKLINAYGPTEACDDITLHILDRAPESDVMPIGKPVRNLKVYVVDGGMNLLPIGVVGELCVSGIGVGRGYLNDPEKTAKVFMEDPFRTEKGVRLYRTGDYARWLPDGSLEYRGRMDHQVKIRGHRIECGEIEARLLGYEGMKEVIVLDRADAHNNKYLCAYFTAMEELDAAVLKEFVLAELPAYMVPSFFVQLDKFPLTPNGKIDRKALPEPEGDLSSAEYVAPRNDTERKLADIWQGVLGVERVGARDHFFELGGHSLKAMVMLSHAAKALGAEVPLRELFNAPTLEGLARAVELQRDGATEGIAAAVIPAIPEQEYYPVSSAQKRIYILDQFEEGESTSYNMSDALRIDGPLQLERLTEAFREMVRRHEILRTSFHSIDGEPYQKVHEEAELNWVVKEVEEHEAEGIARSFVRPFRLDEAPLMRAEVLKLSAERHIVLLDMHHIVSDGETIRLLVDEFIALYGGEELPALTVQYKDFAAWQNERFASEAMKRQEAYWLNQFADGDIPVLQLPTDYARPSMQSFEGDRLAFSAGTELHGQLQRLAGESGATMYMVLLAAYNVLLSKYTGQHDGVIGTPVAGRPHADVLDLAGMFVNTLAVRCRMTPDMTFKELLEVVKTASLGAFENGEYPFEELVDKLNLARDFSRNPLFDTMFSHQMSDMEALAVQGLTFTPFELENRTSKFDLSLDAVESASGIAFELEYSTKLFKRDTVERAAQHYLQIIRAVAANPHGALSDIELLTAAEREQLLVAFNATERSYPQSLTFHEAFVAQAKKTPEHIAVVSGGRSMTYRELNERSNVLAHVLRDKGVMPESIVGIMVGRSEQMLVAALAVMKAGGAYLPIDPDYPADRIAYLLQDSGAALVITEAELLEDVPFSGEIAVLEQCGTDAAGASAEELHEPDNRAEPHHLAYIIYTSGTTGNPKGVMIEHRQYMNVAYAWKEQYELEQFPVRLLGMASFSFDVFAGDMARALLNGGRLIICPNDIKLDPASLYTLMREHEVNIFESTPSLIAPLMEHIYENGLDASFLRLLILGADSCPVEEFRKLLSRFGAEMRIINSYGVTEAAIDSSYYEEALEVLPAAGSVPIGKPLPNMSYYVLDERRRLLPIGVAGELYIGGAGVARGYLGREELTNEKFVSNPYDSGSRLYRTGDLAKWMPDGNLMFLGRNDHQVKVRGYRIELGEIEACLLKHSGIREAIVIAREDDMAQKYLCAYIVGAKELTLGELQAHLTVDLPSYMVPSHVVVLEAMPLTPNGKIDRKALPEPAGLGLKSSEYAAPSTAAEIQLAEIMERVLGMTAVGVNDDFFSLGGHSLKAMVLVSHIHKAFGTAMPLRQVFETPTVAGMARFIEGEEGASDTGFAAIQRVEPQDYYELSSAQKRLFILNGMEGTGTSYNMPDAMLMEGRIDSARVESAFRELISRHESLRTSFLMVNGEPVQRVHAEVDFALSYTELLHASQEELEAAAASFVKPFDLSKAPLMRVGLVKLEDERHLFLFDMHHIVSDGLSMGIIMSEFAALYGGELLPELGLQYKDFAAWQNGLFASGFLQKQEAYWLEALSGELPVLELPTDYPRPSLQSFDGAQLSFRTDAKLKDELNRLASETGTTLYMVLLAAYNVLLAKYSGQSDLIVGTAAAGRSHADLGGVVGMFVNTLAIRTAVDDSRTFRELLVDVKQRLLGAYEHGDYPFEQLVEGLNLSRELSRNPVFDTMFILQNTDDGPLQLGDVKLESLATEQTMTKFDLTLEATELEDRMEFVLEYASRLFSKPTIERMAAHLEALLSEVTLRPDASLSELSLLSAEEKTLLQETFNATAVQHGGTELLHGLVEEQAGKTPRLPAIIAGSRTLTYREWNERANQLARTLRAKGAGPERIVAILADRSVEMAVAILAVLKSGAAYMPIDPEYPQDRIRYMLEDSGALLLLTQGQGDSPYSGDFAGETLNLSAADAYSGDASPLQPLNGPADLAYVIYTSGTTGRPKGVMIQHSSIVNTIIWRREAYGFAPGDRVLQLLSYAFDAFVGSFFAPMAAGGSSIIALDDEAKDPLALKGYIANHGITHFSAVPSLYGAVLEMLSSAEAASLKAVTLGGERVPASFIEKSAALNPQLVLHNEYGPTESSVTATILSGLQADRPVTIGRPIDNTRIYIVDSHLQLQPAGIHGELCISGAGLARGYLNEPELTAEKFVPCPFAPGERMYRTGDRARWLADGTIDFVGRIDHQVKIRGYRIELGEIEASLRKLASVKEAVVIARDDEGGQKYLCAYIVSDDELAVLDLRARLAAELPGYMVPSYFIQLPSMPLTPNGKIDTRALPAPDTDLLRVREYVAPANEVESKLALMLQELLQDTLRVERIGMADNFFDLGGHSLKAMMLVSQLYREFMVEVPLRAIFETATIRDLARFILSAERAEDLSLRPVMARDYYPLSSAQMRLYVLDQLEGPGTGYNMPGVLRMKGALDRARFEGAFQALVDRHESLRTSFHTIETEPKQKVHEHAELHVEWLEAADSAAETEQLIEAFVQPFRLDMAPLLRVGLVGLQENEHLLLFDMHHIVSDGISMSVLIREFVALYRGDSLPPLKVQYKDYAVWQHELFQSKAYGKQEAYWMERFGDEIPVLDLSTDFPRPAVRSLEGDYYEFEADAELLRGLKDLAAHTGTTLFMVLLAAYNVLLAKYANQHDIVVGTPIAGRSHADTEDLIGMFISTLPMRNRPQGSKTFLEFLDEVKRNAYEAYENGDYPFETMVEKLQPYRDLSRNPLFDTVFILQNMSRETMEIDGVSFEPYEYENKISKFDLTLMAEEENDRLALSWEYCTALFCGETMERMAKHYVGMLRAIAQHPERMLAELDMLAADERELLVHTFNASGTIQDPASTLHGLFERQAASAPENVALAMGSEELTYGELNARANRLARKLRERGVGAETVVGVMAHRSFEMITGMLAVMKAGGAYMPIDPAYPADRVTYMLGDSGADIVLAQAHCIADFAAGTSAAWLDLADEALYAQDGSNLPAAGSPDDLAYIIYTSGTTGKPKGVMIQHRSISGNIWWRKEAYGLTDRDAVLQLFSFAFDGFVTSFYTPIVSGSAVVLLLEDEAKDPVAIKDAIKRHGVTHFISVPSLYAGVLECMSREDAASLRMVTLAGEKVTDKTIALSKSVNDGIELINEYGPTESSVVATIERDLQPGAPITIGRPIAGTAIRILGGDGGLAPIGAAGELCIAGAGLARGYVGLPEMTAERFTADPLQPGERMYRTGDAARWLPDGRIEYIGRIDHQVKVRGYRIELGEIEGALLRQPGVKETVVLARDDDGSGKYLCAYVTAERELNTAVLKDELAKVLPEYMVPPFIIQLAGMPVTPNGKVDRRALPEPDRNGLWNASAYVAPAGEREQIMADIWAEVLGAERIGTGDHFFHLGGDSIKAIQVAARLNKFGLRLEIRDLFRYPTISELVPRLKATDRIIEQGAVTGEVPLTPIQSWFFESRFRDMHYWNQSELIYRPQGFDVELLHTVFRKLTEHHDALRLRYAAGDDDVIKGYNEDIEGEHYSLAVIDLRGRTGDEIKGSILAEGTAIQSGMDLAHGPLVKLGLFRTNEGDHLLIAIHHLAVDGVSWRILFEDLAEAYRQAEQGEAITLPAKTDSYRYWSQQMAAYASSDELLKEAAYWHKLGGLDFAPLPKDKAGADNLVKHMRSVERELAAEATEQLLKGAHEAYRTEMNDLLMAALALALKDWSKGNTIAVNLEGHGREAFVEGLDITRTVGWFTSQFPVVLDMEQSEDLAYIIKSTKETLRKIPNKGIGYGILKYMTDRLRDLTLQPEISFNYLGQFDGDAESGNGMEPSSYDAGLPFSADSQRPAALDVSGLVTEGKLKLALHYNAQEYEASTAERLIDRLQERLLAIIAHCTLKETTELTPSDLGDDELTLEELDSLLESIEF
ncbi:non-ribosomal peptide synthase/polyketide synthase [Paenibacillus oenotherae]|uniref:Non-ribosomal peptide synthase/polyketide synthase n=1 Tax=Paenibacillus oenotherae TaxID=1435645 RepID=A0ABS7D1L8_9BACL|nr:non-ribosomal peptide synthase/polyketide synthase [Paenibacillus oenotherae]MBW7473808.1 non-ribosomal peptide synthase/polyketide synthase [Paenibacillus oenotherae]